MYNWEYWYNSAVIALALFAFVYGVLWVWREGVKAINRWADRKINEVDDE